MSAVDILCRDWWQPKNRWQQASPYGRWMASHRNGDSILQKSLEKQIIMSGELWHMAVIGAIMQLSRTVAERF
jgi:hypothetical protein